MQRVRSTPRLITVISLLFSVIWLSPALAMGMPVFASLGQIKADALRVPGSMALDGAGNLYVADSRGGKVHKFDPYGALLQSFDLQVTGRGIAAKPDGSVIYVARKQSVVMVNAADGSVLGALAGAESTGPEFGVAGDVVLDAAGNVFVTDDQKMQVKCYNAAGQFVSRFGAPGNANGQFSQIGGMEFTPSGRLVVTDISPLNGKAHVFTLNANLSVASVVAYSKLSPANFGSPPMHVPRSLTFDGQGRGYFLESFSSQLRVTNASFGYLGVFNQTGYTVGKLKGITDAVFDKVNSRLLVGCDTGRIEIFGIDGGQNPVQLNRAPSVPTPQSPVGGSVIDSASPTLVFGNATDPDGDALTYQVVISKAGEVAYQATVAGAAGASTSATVTGVALEENAAYTWTVQAFDAKTSSDVSAAASFVVNAVNEPPGAPVLLGPANDASAAAADLLTWTETTDPDPNDYVAGYLVEISPDATFAEVLLEQSVATGALALGDLQDYALLEDGTTYFWRVKAFDKGQATSVGGDAGRFVYDTTQLTITANVPDAQVYLGGNHAYAGRALGVTPLELRDVPPGMMSLVVKRPGLEPYVASLMIAERENARLAAVLVPAMESGALSGRKDSVNGRSGLAVDGNAAPFLVDYNNDGMLDVLIGDAAGQLRLYTDMQILSQKKIVIAAGVTLALPVMPGAVPFVVDWDNDGRKDLLIGLGDGSVRLFRNLGQEETPAFGEGLELNAGAARLNVGSGAAPAVVDLDGDGLKDLLVGNGSGQVRVFYNRGSDALPQLSDPVTLFTLTGPVVPMPVDWDADGRTEIMATSSGITVVYALNNGSYQPVEQVSGITSGNFAAFPLDLDGGKMKELFVGARNGQLELLSGSGGTYLASFQQALQDKVAELGGLVAEQAPELLANVTAIGALVDAGSFAAVPPEADALALQTTGAANVSARELADLCR